MVAASFLVLGLGAAVAAMDAENENLAVCHLQAQGSSAVIPVAACSLDGGCRFRHSSTHQSWGRTAAQEYVLWRKTAVSFLHVLVTPRLIKTKPSEIM